MEKTACQTSGAKGECRISSKRGARASGFDLNAIGLGTAKSIDREKDFGLSWLWTLKIHAHRPVLSDKNGWAKCAQPWGFRPVGDLCQKVGIAKVAAAGVKKVIRVHTQSCQSAYKNGIRSVSVAEVSDAADVCIKASEAACTSYVERNSDGPDTGDGIYVASMCELKAAYGAYSEVRKMK